MKRISAKGKQRLQDKKEAYAKFDENNDGECKGCRKFIPGSHSHLIPLSEAPELIGEVKNLTWHCMQCHALWESHNIEKMKIMLDFEENIEYIRVTKPLYYNRLISK